MPGIYKNAGIRIQCSKCYYYWAISATQKVHSLSIISPSFPTPLPISPSLSLSISVPLSPSLCLSVFVSLFLSRSVCLSVCLSVFPPFFLSEVPIVCVWIAQIPDVVPVSCLYPEVCGTDPAILSHRESAAAMLLVPKSPYVPYSGVSHVLNFLTACNYIKILK